MNTTSMLRMIAGGIAVASLAACSTYSVSRYSISADDVVALRKLPPNSVSVGSFTSANNDTQIMCRGVGPIKTPDGETFAEYIRRALISELKIAGAYSDDAPLQVTGALDSADFSSNSGRWNLNLSVKSSNGRGLSVTEAYPYTSSFYGETACNQTAQALMPAVQDLIGKAVTNPAFPALVTK
jgi:hypothetical protein